MGNDITDNKTGLLHKFLNEILVPPAQWFSDQRLTLNRAFPDIIFKMFDIWYTQYTRGTDKCTKELFPDLKSFARTFERIYIKYIRQHHFRFECVKSKSKYCLQRYSYKYTFPVRLSKLGTEIYARSLPDGDAIADTVFSLSDLHDFLVHNYKAL
jgi:hypothetical protein